MYNWLSAINCTPGPDNSNLIKTENAVPIRPDNKANIRYKVPMSLAFDDKNHLSNHNDMLLLLVVILEVKLLKGLKGSEELINDRKRWVHT